MLIVDIRFELNLIVLWTLIVMILFGIALSVIFCCDTKKKHTVHHKDDNKPKHEHHITVDAKKHAQAKTVPEEEAKKVGETENKKVPEPEAETKKVPEVSLQPPPTEDVQKAKPPAPGFADRKDYQTLAEFQKMKLSYQKPAEESMGYNVFNQTALRKFEQEELGKKATTKIGKHMAGETKIIKQTKTDTVTTPKMPVVPAIKQPTIVMNKPVKKSPVGTIMVEKFPSTSMNVRIIDEEMQRKTRTISSPTTSSEDAEERKIPEIPKVTYMEPQRKDNPPGTLMEPMQRNEPPGTLFDPREKPSGTLFDPKNKPSGTLFDPQHGRRGYDDTGYVFDRKENGRDRSDRHREGENDHGHDHNRHHQFHDRETHLDKEREHEKHKDRDQSKVKQKSNRDKDPSRAHQLRQPHYDRH